MRYINTKTRAIIDSPFAISGGDWAEYSPAILEAEESIDKVEIDNAKKEEKIIEASSDITKKEIMAELDALGIEYDSKSKKEDLYKLMMGE
ncbi:hypothetical protein [Anaerococcus marasmi]|uniref:hypothetical protein n=1 Tax=Anaerococcus marasmi TaxID=2057797 RepID=UPI000CF9CF14|nr:hypothetical protein [Anaerococcus marasmi]